MVDWHPRDAVTHWRRRRSEVDGHWREVVCETTQQATRMCRPGEQRARGGRRVLRRRSKARAPEAMRVKKARRATRSKKPLSVKV